MQNTRSYLARFSGLILFILALAIVGFLIYFTVQSARDEDVSTSENTETTSQQDVESERDNQIADDSEGVVDTNEPAAVDTNDSGSASVTPEDSEFNDEPVPSPDDEQVAGAETLANTGPTEDLPNTGPESVIFGAVAGGVLVWSVISYNRSQKYLVEAMKQHGPS